MPQPDFESENYHMLDRLTDAAIEHQLIAQAHAQRRARVNEVVSFLSEHGVGDNISDGRVGRVAQRLVNEGVLVIKNEEYRLSERGAKEANQALNLAEQAFHNPWEDEHAGAGP